MSPSSAPSFLSRVRQRLPDCPPVERRLAEFVLDFPGDLASYTASELAKLAGVSNATVTRFIRRVGYEHFEAARLQVRAERSAGSPLYLASRRQSADTPFGSQLGRSQDNLQRTLARLTPEAVADMAAACLVARKVWVVGLRSSQSFATYFRWQLFQLKEAVQTLPTAGDTLGQYLASIQPADVVVVFALRRRPAVLHTLTQRLIGQGARVLCISDQQLPSHAGLAWHVYCACEADTPLDDHTAVAAVCHLLLSAVLEQAGPAERARLSAIETSHDALQEL